MLFISKMRSMFTPPSLPTFFPSPISKPTVPSPFSLQFSQTLNPKTPKSLNLRKASSSSFKSSMESSQLSCGAVHVIIGPMFAGKTTALLRRIQSETDDGKSVAIIKSNKDTRYGLDSIVTHDGAKLPCWALPDLLSLRERLGTEVYDKLDVIGIDEAQFFGDLYDFCCEAADQDGKIVIVAGLDGDYLRKRFGSVLDVVPLADTVTKLTARCELCGKRAMFTLRKTEDKETELIGGADVYMPVCRKHYVSGQGVIEAARTVLETRKAQCDTNTIFVEAVAA